MPDDDYTQEEAERRAREIAHRLLNTPKPTKASTDLAKRRKKTAPVGGDRPANETGPKAR